MSERDDRPARNPDDRNTPLLSPHPDSVRLGCAIDRALPSAVRVRAHLYRAAAARRANRIDLISGEGSRLFGGRWNPPHLFPTVYLSFEVETAVAEYFARNRKEGLPDAQSLPLVLVGVSVRADRVLDLSLGAMRRLLRVSGRRMIEEPHGDGRESITQAIGRLARSAGFEGLKVPSAARRGGSNLVVFPDRLPAPDRMQPLRPDELPPVPARGT